MTAFLGSNELATNLGVSTCRIAGGVLAARKLPTISKKICHYLGIQEIGDLLDKMIPISMQSLSKKCAAVLGSPIIRLQFKLHEHGYSRAAFSSWYSNLISPLLEEAIFRFGVQGGSTYVLTQMGLHPDIAAGISIAFSSILFGQAHEPKLDREEFSCTMLYGAVFGILQNYGNFPEAALTHIVFNSTLRSV